MLIRVDKILPNPQQPRVDFDQAALEELAGSIQEHGLINAIAVEEVGEHYILIDGERRLRACKLIGLEEIEASIRPGMNGKGSQERLLLAMIANLQRRDNNPIEEAKAFQKLKEMGFTSVEIARQMGISESQVNFRIRLLEYDEPIQKLIAAGKISPDPRAFRALMSVEDMEMRNKIALRAALKRTSIQGLILMCVRFGVKKKTTQKIKRNEMGRFEAANKWSIMNDIKKSEKPVAWVELEKAVVQVCKECVLAEQASEVNCKECPLVELVKSL